MARQRGDGGRFQPAAPPTEQQKAQVRAMAGFGLPQKDIAVVMEMDLSALKKRYRRELDQGMARGNLEIGQSLFQQAVGRVAEYEGRKRVRDELKPNIAAAIFLGKTRLGLQEVTRNVITVQDIDPTKLSTEELTQLETLLAKADRRAAPHDLDGAGGDKGREGAARGRVAGPGTPGPDGGDA